MLLFLRVSQLMLVAPRFPRQDDMNDTVVRDFITTKHRLQTLQNLSIISAN